MTTLDGRIGAKIQYPRVAPLGGFFIEAACRGSDTNIFFPGQGEDSAEAKAICRECAVVEECLEWAVFEERPKFGIYAGSTERDRGKIRAGRVSMKDHLEKLRRGPR